MRNLSSDIKKILVDYKYHIFKKHLNACIFVLDPPNFYYPVAAWYKNWVNGEFDIDCKNFIIKYMLNDSRRCEGTT